MPSSFRRRVKIVCTLGPSSRTPEQISGLISDGMNVARLNFSHGTHSFHHGLIATVRKAARAAGRNVAIMQDLQGPKLRAGKLPNGALELRAGDVLLLYPEGHEPRLPTQGKILVPISAEIAHSISKEAHKGVRILFDDGRIVTHVTRAEPPELVVEVQTGGTLTDHKGMNLPDTPLSMPCLTEKDLIDLKFGLSQQVDAVALSFVRSPKDVEILRKKLERASNFPPMVVSKIEREEALEFRDAIIERSDALLIARGDMAVEIGAARVPVVQKQLIQACNQAGVPVITATQMLESMISCPTPTRAEATDVANAVFDGTDAVMLSGETAAGQYPREALQTMIRIIVEAERWATYSRHRLTAPRPGDIVESVESSAAVIAHNVGAQAIACITHTGSAAQILSRYRPEPTIVAVMDNERMLRRLSFVWGVRGALVNKIGSTEGVLAMVERVMLKGGWAEAKDLVVVTAGVPTLRKGTTNMIKVHRLGAP